MGRITYKKKYSRGFVYYLLQINRKYPEKFYLFIFENLIPRNGTFYYNIFINKLNEDGFDVLFTSGISNDVRQMKIDAANKYQRMCVPTIE